MKCGNVSERLGDMLRPHFNADWCFAIQGVMRDMVEKNFPSDLHRWPLLQTFDAHVYDTRASCRVFVFRDKAPSSSVPSVNSAVTEWPEDAPTIGPLALSIDYSELITAIRNHFDLRDKDAVFVIPEMEGESVEDDWENHWPGHLRAIFDVQIKCNVRTHLHSVKGLSAMGRFSLPPGYESLSDACQRFFRDHPNYDKNVFLMTRFDSSSRPLVELDVELRRVLRAAGYNPVRADDKVYATDRNLWNNVCIYMLCCMQGVAILEDRAKDEFNPNVALEYGFMRALNRNVLLFADVGFRNLRADIIGTLREQFDITDISATVGPSLERWIRDL
ncbi:hypothetical protein [Streptomyces sp. NPDC127036]|uniref:hypothetical protein n=1 Tax=Streptomyces sp. NPDC127036 TaxID=3347112 RepID=UPI00365C72C4